MLSFGCNCLRIKLVARKWGVPVRILVLNKTLRSRCFLLLQHSLFLVLLIYGPVAAAQKTSGSTLVNVVKVHQGTVWSTASALGSIKASQNVMISAQQSGQVKAVYFKSGQSVSAGMPIAQLANEKALADYRSAVSALKVEQQKYNRSKLLLNEAVSLQALAELAANVDKAKAQVQQAQTVVNNKKIVAPFDGTLGDFKVEVGDYVTVGAAIVRLVNRQQLAVSYAMAERYLPSLKLGQLVTIKAAAYANQSFFATVNFIAPSVDPHTRTVAMRALLSRPSRLLLPGMFVHVTQQLAVNRRALMLPQRAVGADIQGYYVFRVQNHRAEKVYVEIGARTQDQVVIKKGVVVGEIIVSDGLQKLSDGDRVQFDLTTTAG